MITTSKCRIHHCLGDNKNSKSRKIVRGQGKAKRQQFRQDIHDLLGAEKLYQFESYMREFRPKRGKSNKHAGRPQ